MVSMDCMWKKPKIQTEKNEEKKIHFAIVITICIEF